jgi:hypothetical protein
MAKWSSDELLIMPLIIEKVRAQTGISLTYFEFTP